MCEDCWASLEYCVFLKEIRRIANIRTVQNTGQFRTHFVLFQEVAVYEAFSLFT
jgi:hypothetical protein